MAQLVKLADIAENMNLGRISEPTERDLARLRECQEFRALLLAATGD